MPIGRIENRAAVKITITFEPQEIETVKRIVADKLTGNRRFVQYRWQNNVAGPAPQVSDEALWQAQMMCLLTTQQRSGPNSSINKLLGRNPFPLSLGTCRQSTDLRAMTFQLLTEAQGIRRTNRIAGAVSANFNKLEHGEWDHLRRWRDRLGEQRSTTPDPAHRAVEEQAADYMKQFVEFGPKQSRNFWQSLGLTRYVFVLDSRIIRWIRQQLTIESGLLTSDGLGNGNYYQFISDLLFELCVSADVLPCMFDAAVFDSFDESTEWTDDVIW